jgi:hypothetical protein
MADLYRQHHKAEEDEQQTAPAADAIGRPQQSWRSLSFAMRPHGV